MEQLSKEQLTIPYIAYESMLAKEDTQQRRMVYIIIFLIALLVVTNVIWLVAWNQYDYVDVETEISAEQSGGNVNIVGAGNIDYGTEGSYQTESAEQNAQ